MRRPLIIPIIAASIWSTSFCEAAEPSNITSGQELSKVFPRAKKEVISLGKKEIVVLYLYKGSSFIHQVLHIFTKHENTDDLTWKFSVMLNSRKGIVKVSEDGTRLEIITEKGKTVAMLDASLMSSDKKEFLSR